MNGGQRVRIGLRQGVRLERTRHGMSLVQADVVLSQVRDRPGPLDGPEDLLAACVAALGPTGGRLGMLGFAAGGLLAPLRALGQDQRLEAVDSSSLGRDLFDELAAAWAGPVTVAADDAVRWLRRRRGRFDGLIDDLSIPRPAGVTKPEISVELLPELMQERLAPAGVALTNLLPIPGRSWQQVLAAVSAPYREALLIFLDDFENRIVVAGRTLPSAALLSRRLKRLLDGIGSGLARRFSVRTLRSQRDLVLR